MSIWDDIPEATEVDLTRLSESQRSSLLKEYIDEDKATQLVQSIDGSASDYESNMARIEKVLGYINSAVNGAIKITSLLA